MSPIPTHGTSRRTGEPGSAPRCSTGSSSRGWFTCRFCYFSCSERRRGESRTPSSSRRKRPLVATDVLDTVVAAETPEGILLELRPAGLTARFYAFTLDWMVRLAIVYAAATATAVFGGIGIAFWLILLFALE